MEPNISISQLLNGITKSEFDWFEDKHREFSRKGEYDKSARCLIACCIYGEESADAEDYLFNIDETTDQWIGHPERFTSVELEYCEQILIPKLISLWTVDIKEPAEA